MSPSRPFLVSAISAAIVLSAPSFGGESFVSVAEAQDAGKPDYAAAKKHYAAAEAAAAAKKWDVAAKEYGVAYEITKDPVLFFKLGNAYQLSGDCTRAVEYFERYLAEANPSEQYMADTRSRISTCQSSMAKTASKGSDVQQSGDAAPAATETGNRPLEPSLTDDGSDEETGTGDDLVGPGIEAEAQPSFMDEETTWQQTAGWTSVGITAAFLTASAVLGLSANSREEDLENLITYRDASGRPAAYDDVVSERYDKLADEGDSLNTMSMIALGGAGISAAAAIVFFVLDSRVGADEDATSSLSPTLEISPSGRRSVGVGWSF